MTERWYTVVLMYPERLRFGDAPHRCCYIAYARATSPTPAIQKARREVRACQPWHYRAKAAELKLVVCLKGKAPVARYGFQD